ncbi:hypothetical protein [Neobacillus sp. LXY-4]|uniref:hypothetical protein n=1 Tax=Neobacillus sp. LXY-4 TaxID=3379826 RepID=UPI003EE191EE
MKEKERRLFFNMFIGSIGLLLIAIVAMGHLVEEFNSGGYLMIVFGFILTMNYINYLEEKAGISKKLTWARASISIVLLFVVSYFLYF